MGKKKHEYYIYINCFEKSDITITYDYRSIKNIVMDISRSGARIHFFMTKDKDHQSILHATDKMVQDAIRKAIVISYLYSGQAQTVKAIILCVDGGAPEIFLPDSSSPILFSMFREDARQLSKAWNDSNIFQTVCSFTKTKEKDDSRFAALYAFLVSKSTVYEIERFTYLWMAMNGLYGFIAKQATPFLPLSAKGKPRKFSEDDSIRFMAQLKGWKFDCAISNKNKASFFQKAELVAADKDCWISDTQLGAALSDIAKDIGEEIQIEPAAFALLWFPYQLRCKYFHGEMPILALCFADEYLLRVFKNVNDRLELFLEEYLPQWLGEYKMKQEPLMQSLASSFVMKSEMK